MTDVFPTMAPLGEERPPPARRRAVREILGNRPSAVAGAVILVLFAAVALLAPWIRPYGVGQRVGPVYARPSTAHWLGLDDAGFDVLSLLIEGSRISLLVGLAAMVISTVVGGGIGVVAGYFGGRVDSVLMRVTDYALVIPALPLMIVIASVWGPSLLRIILVIGLLLWTWTARIVRAQVRSVRRRVFVMRARCVGAGHGRIILRHVVPQIAPLLVANVMLTTAYAIFYETALAFLGLSDPTATSWGTMLRHAFERTAISVGAWWAIVPAGVCIGVVVMACYLVAQAIEEALNPRLRAAHLSPRRFRVAERPAPVDR